MTKRGWIAVGVAGLAVVGLLAWAFAPRPVEVETATVTQGPFETVVEEDGRTRVRDRFVVVSPIGGRLKRPTLREGDAVTSGAPLALIDPLPAPLLDERSRREQQARVASLQAALERAQTRVRAAEIGVEQALNEQRRTAQLLAVGFISAAKAEADRLAVDAARREQDAAVQSERVAGHDLAQARVALEVPSRGKERARASGVFAVHAPVAGRVLKVHAASEGVVAPGTPLLELGDIARIEIVAELLTAEATQVLPGATVRIERWGGAGTLVGRVRAVEPAAFTKVSALGVEEQRVPVMIDLDAAPPATDAGVMGDGWRVVVRIVTLHQADVRRVPVSAVFPWPAQAPEWALKTASLPAPGPRATSGAVAGEGDAVGQMGVFVVEDGRAQLRAVQVGARNGSLAWIRAGLSVGEAVIAYPPLAVADGVRVRPRQ
jgi:HlyD family secretion protein